MRAKFSDGHASFNGAKFTGGLVDFDGARLYGGAVDFFAAEFSGSLVSFGDARFASQVSFLLAKFSGGEVDFSKVADWAHQPYLNGGGTQPPGVLLPSRSVAAKGPEGAPVGRFMR
jgi:hypothetical protein